MLLALLAACSPAVRCAPRATIEREVLFGLRDRAIAESSGIAVAQRDAGVYFTHNDSGDSPRFFAVGGTGATLATIEVPGAHAVDWEDMGTGRDVRGRPVVYLADFGDNTATRSGIVIYEVAEPAIKTAWRARRLTVGVQAAYRFRYPDEPYNAETLLVDPVGGRLAIVTKTVTGRSRVFATKARPSASAVTTLERVGSINFNTINTDIGFGEQLQATGGSVRADGKQMVVRTYAQAYAWPLRDFDLRAALKRAPTHIALPPQRQGEAIAYAGMGSFIVSSEGVGTDVYSIKEVKRC